MVIDTANVFDAYNSVFGETNSYKEIKVPEMLPLSLNDNLVRSAIQKAADENKWVLLFVLGTKPCFYKFYGSIISARQNNVPYIIINANQHYDDNLTYGIKEFGLDIAINLNIRGSLLQKTVELLTKFGYLAKYFTDINPKVEIVPVVLGDTILTSIVPIAWMFSKNEKVIQNEAGLRGMAPLCLKEKKLKPEEFFDGQQNGKWMILRNEPFPEQWDTFVSGAGAQFMFPPLEINRQHLLREGYQDENIFPIGGVVVDALNLKLSQKPKTSIFNLFPQLEKGQWIRCDIHRRENIGPSRFKAVILSLKRLLDAGYKINFIEMNATKFGIDRYGLRDTINKLKENPNFVVTDVWPEYSHVIEFYKSDHCLTAFTDSGGVQEEMNLLNKPCLTCRFNTDRPETVMDAKTNLLIPPINDQFIFDSISYADKKGLLEQLRKGPKIYGDHPGDKLILQVMKLMKEKRKLFTWSHEALGFKDEEESSGFL